MDKLAVISDGGAHTIEYLIKNGVIPSAVVIEPDRFQELSPYMNEDWDILLIIKGLTDFSMASVYAALSKLEEIQEKFKRVTIMTNIPLGNVKYEYYLYSGDLFYGEVKKVINRKQYDLDEMGNIIEKQQQKSFFNKKNVVEPVKGKNPIMFKFKKYNDKRTKVMFYGTKPKEETTIETVQKVEYEDKVRAVDLYSKGNEKKLDLSKN